MIVKRQLIKISVFSTFSFYLFFAFSPVFAQLDDEEKNFLLMYFKEEELVVVSPTRGEKPITQVAENVTVITADDIKLMNAHTLSDVLNTVTGVQVFSGGGPGNSARALIQGSEDRHVAVFMDGIPLNILLDNVSDIGLIRVQNIEKIEIIKGPASSAWGSALGGVINIITKTGSRGDESSPDPVGTSGMVSASYGEKNTGDFRAEASGKEKRLGYYFNAGRLQTDGFRPHNDFSGNNAYTKLTYDITKKTSLLFTLGYDEFSRGEVEIPVQDLFTKNKEETLTATFAVNSSLNKETELNLSFRHLRQIFDRFNYQLSSGAELPKDRFVDDGYGSSVKLTWKHKPHNIVLGADYDAKTVESNTIAGEEHSLRKSAFFINDTMSFKRFSVTPGIREDHTNTNGDFTSPSLGMTYKIADNTLLRAYTARGFSIPPLIYVYGSPSLFFEPNPDLKVERVSSYELGAETAALKYLWLKLSGFRHEVRDAIFIEPISGFSSMAVNSARQRRQGMEIEIKTSPVYNTSLSAGASFIHAEDLNTSETVPNVPQRTYDLGLEYNDEKSFKALLKGHYIYWNAHPLFEGEYDSFIFDLHITKNLYTHNEHTLEAFVDLHNIFNGSQYLIYIYKNPERWFEGGVRYTF